MLNHHNGIHTRCAKNEHRAVRRQERALIAQGTRRSDEPSEKQGGGERGGDLEAGARGPGDGLLLLLVHAGRRLRGDQPLPALPGHPARPSPACSRNRGRAWRRGKKTENPNDFQEKHQDKNAGNFERNRRRENKGARVPAEVGFGAHDSGNAAADSSEMSGGIARGGGFLPALGFSLPLGFPFLLVGQGFIRGEGILGFWVC